MLRLQDVRLVLVDAMLESKPRVLCKLPLPLWLLPFLSVLTEGMFAMKEERSLSSQERAQESSG